MEDPDADAAERHAVLLNEDIEVMRAHLVKGGSYAAATAKVEVLRIAWHKARAVATGLPDAEVRRSVAWLKLRGYSPSPFSVGGDS